MKQDAIIETVAGQAGDPLDMSGREVGAKLDDDVAAGEREVSGYWRRPLLSRG
jgi:hypothetical protein